MARVLIGCEFSGVLRRAFRALGHDAYSCDIDAAEDGSTHHFRCDVRRVLKADWDLAIFHPPCTYLTIAGLFRNKNNPARQEQTERALEFVQELLDAPIPRIALENPVSCISTRIRKPDQIIQPYEFGDDASKRTCLWLKGLPLIHKQPAHRLRGRFVNHNGKTVERWSNQTDSGQNKLGPSADRGKIRSRTYPYFAKALAEQWSRSIAANDNDPALKLNLYAA